MRKIFLSISTIFVLLFGCNSCTNLDEKLNQNLTADQAVVAGSASDALNAAYQQLQDFQHTDFMFVLQEHPTDEMAGPTRGADWDDGGAWRALHLHTWNSSHPRIVGSWNSVLSGLFRATEVLGFTPDASEKAQATMLRSLFIYSATDLFGTVPIREPGEDLSLLPSITASRTEAIDIAINDLEAELSNLPSTKTPAIANIYAGHTLLAKMYLNRAVYKATDADGTPQVGPFSFTTEDMNNVIAHCDAVINAGLFSLEDDYYSNFSTVNSETSSEIIFVSQNTHEFGGEIRRFNFMTLHYNQNPGSWNGFVALSDFYNSFEDGDVRKSADVPYLQQNSGLKGGFLIGQQFDKNNVALKDRQGNPLVFTPDFILANSDEVRGIRVVKYSPDYSNIDRPDQDYVFFRYADVLLMKAEALFRNGNSGEALTIINDIRNIRGASTLGSLTEADILAERGRELYWEGQRRTDQIRFGTLLNPVQEKPNASDRTKLVFPIPAEALATNPNLRQNPGY